MGKPAVPVLLEAMKDTRIRDIASEALLKIAN
jgi:hypothetical protein